MIINTHNKLYPNQIFDGYLTDQDQTEHDVRFLVLREASQDEYINYCKEQGCSDKIMELNGNYYEISID